MITINTNFKLPVVPSIEINEGKLKLKGLDRGLSVVAIKHPFTCSQIRGHKHVTRVTTLGTIFAKAPAIYLNMKEQKELICDQNSKKAGVYLITNKINKKHYVGKSICLDQRFRNYFSEAYVERNKDIKIYNILSKLGYNNFSLTILEYCTHDNSILSEREQYYIDIFKPLYNIRKSVTKDSESKVNKKTHKSTYSQDETFSLFNKLFKNRIPQKVAHLIDKAEKSDPQLFYMNIGTNKQKNNFTLHFWDHSNFTFYYANTAY
jgi:group I intron endonuclease